MKISRKLALMIVAGAILQLSVYLYLDQILFAPTAAFTVKDTEQTQVVSGGKAYYSRDRKYMANITEDAVELYTMPGRSLVRSISLNGQKVSYFKWLEDRNLALMATYDEESANGKVVLSQLNPLDDKHEMSTKVEKLPKGSKIHDVAYSTATNVIYMQVQTAVKPEAYRVYRTDANRELSRIFFNTNKVGRIGVLPYQDIMIFDNLENNTIVARNGDGSWQVISPTAGKYRMIGVDAKSDVFIARLNTEGLAENVLKGNAKGSFVPHKKLPAPVEAVTLQIADVTE
ncbi:MAG TPA: hypothetical protein VN611_16275 [Patescibacteria group bacterium]|nr:hypothetical protein [Patescibacteria group bacterium]